MKISMPFMILFSNLPHYKLQKNLLTPTALLKIRIAQEAKTDCFVQDLIQKLKSLYI